MGEASYTKGSLTGVKRVRASGLCFAVGVLEGFDIQIVGVAAPTMGPALALSPGQLSGVFFASSFGLLGGAAAGGWLADRLGRRAVLVAASFTFGVFTLATANVERLSTLLALRLLAGVGLGAGLANLAAVAADLARPERRAFMTGLMFCGVPLGGALVALASGTLSAHTGWRGLFVVGGVLPLVVSALQLRWLPETTPAQGRAVIGTWVGLFADGRTAQTLLLWVAIAPTLMALYLVLYWLPALTVATGLSRETAAHAAALFNLGGVAGALTVGRLLDRLGPRAVLGPAFAALIAMAVLLARATSAPAVLALAGVIGFLLLGLNYALYGLAARIYPEAARGNGAGAAVAAGRIGSIVGPAAPGLLIALGGNEAGALWLIVPAVVLGGVAAVMLSVHVRLIVPRLSGHP